MEVAVTVAAAGQGWPAGGAKAVRASARAAGPAPSLSVALAQGAAGLARCIRPPKSRWLQSGGPNSGRRC